MCFKERNSKVCGNSRVEEGEECDPGLLHLNDDPCCASDCKFKKRAQCRYEIQQLGEMLLFTLSLRIPYKSHACSLMQ